MDSDYTARQLLSTLWMRPDLLPVAAQELARPDLLTGVPGYLWGVLQAHIAGGKLHVARAQAALDQHPQAGEWLQLAQRENPYPHRYGQEQIAELSRELAEAGYRRIGAGEAERLQGRINNLDVPLDEVIRDAVRTFSGLREGAGPTWRDMPTIAEGSRAMRAAWQRGETVNAEPTGFCSLDRLLGGFLVGELSLIAARPSIGKTALACSILVNQARRYRKEGKGRVAAFFSAETSGELLQLRMAYALAGVDVSDSRLRHTTPEQEARVDQALELIETLPIFIDESAAPTTDNMLVRAMGLSSMAGQVGIVFFDFVELAGDVDASEEQRISRIARGLKVIAKTLKCPVVALSQLSRAAGEEMPQLYHLRYSGMLEQIAYAVLFLHRPSYYKKRRNLEYRAELDPERRLAPLMVAKNKDGKTGPVELHFYEEFARFVDPNDPHTRYDEWALAERVVASRDVDDEIPY